MTTLTLTNNATPRKSAYAEYFEAKHSLELAAWALHPHKDVLLARAYEAVLEALEERDWGQYPENFEVTRDNFMVKFETYRGEAAYRYCLETRDTYKQR